MTAVHFPPDLELSVRNTFVHCAEEEEDSPRRVAARPRSKTGPASLFSNLLLDADLTEEPEEAGAPVDSQASDEARVGGREEELQVDESHFAIQSVQTRDFFEDVTPQGLYPLETPDAIKEVLGERFGHATPGGAAPPPRLGPQPGHEESPAWQAESSETGSTKPRGGASAKIEVRNTFVHFVCEEGDDTPSQQVGAHRRARTTQTVPARVLEDALPKEELDTDNRAGASPPDSALPQPQEAQQCFENLPTLLQQQHQRQSVAAHAHKVKSHMETARGAGATAEMGGTAEALGGAPRADIATPGPMYVEQTPSTVKATRRKPRRAELSEGRHGPQLRVSVRNTFLHIDEPEDAERTPAPHQRPGRRSKTGPPATLVFDDVSDNADEAEEEQAAEASQPCKVPVGREQPGDFMQPGQMTGMAGNATMMPGMYMPIAMQPGVVPPFFPGFNPMNPMAPFWPQAMPLCPPAMPPSAAPSEFQSAPAVSAPASSTARQTNERTTVVLQNLPLNYRRSMLLRMLDAEGFAGEYDFAYLPMDFKTRAGFGYAFVNLVDPSSVPRFWRAFDGYKKWMFPSAKVCTVSWSVPHQGLKAHIKRYRNSPLMHESVPDEYKPVLFSGGTRVAFPPPTKELAAPSQKALVKAPRRSKCQAAS